MAEEKQQAKFLEDYNFDDTIKAINECPEDKKDEKVFEETKEYWQDRIFKKESREVDYTKLRDVTNFVYRLGNERPPSTIMVFKNPEKMIMTARLLTEDKSFSRFSYFCNISDYGWMSFYDYYSRLGVIDDPVINQYKMFLECNVFDSILLDDAALYLAIPELKIEDDKLHCEDGPAVRWVDFDDEPYEMYFWKDYKVNKEILLEQDKVTKEMLQEFGTNAEGRRACIEIMGVTKYFEIMSGGEGLKLIDEDKDHQGNQMKLMEFNFEGTTIQVLEVKCPSTDRIYNLYPINGPHKNVWDAKGSTFDMSGEEMKKTVAET